MNINIQNKIKTLPTTSGVYLMRNIEGQVIYVGKAKSLKNRVSQYFRNGKKQAKVQAMVDKVADFDYFLCISERDSLALENNLIKKYMPFYNILLKDGKAFPYIKLNKQKYPFFEVTRKLKNDGAKYFGPYISGLNPNSILKIINLAFQVRTCKYTLSEDKMLKRECLNYDLGLCSAPCTHKISVEQYDKNIRSAIDFLNGNDNTAEIILQNKMELAVETENFEKAIEYRDAINMIKKLKDKVISNFPKDVEVDVFGYQNNGLSGALTVITVRGGKILGIQSFSCIDASISEGEIISSFMLQYYERVMPAQEILVSDEIVEKEELENILTEKLGKKVCVSLSQIGYKHRLIEMAKDNCLQFIEKELSVEKKKYEKTMGALERLQSALNLPKLPLRIECYDISNISGTNQVSSMVVFINGEKNSKHYRKFKIKYVKGQNDFECMKETLTRRLSHLNDKDISFSQMPDLLVIDGGKGQLSSVVEVLDELHKNIPVISLAKRMEEVYIPGQAVPILLRRASVELNLLQNIRDEAHRFAITFHRQLREKSMLKK